MIQSPEEKAKELVEKFGSKNLALICVEEILIIRPVMPSPLSATDIEDCIIQAKKYWQSVKTSIQNIQL